jgi:hypothetical protein
MYVNGEFLGYTLEDVPRPYGVKIPGETCIPDGVYKIELTWSPRFQKIMPLIYTEDDDSINKKGITFTGVRVHGGNTHEDTEGCPILAENVNMSEGEVFGCSKVNKKLISILEDHAVPATLIITNKG